MNIKKAVDLIVSATYCEESARELNGIKDDDLIEICTYLKMANNLIEKKFVKEKGIDNIIKMSYGLIDIFKEISYLSIENQNKVKEYVRRAKYDIDR